MLSAWPVMRYLKEITGKIWTNGYSKAYLNGKRQEKSTSQVPPPEAVACLMRLEAAKTKRHDSALTNRPAPPPKVVVSLQATPARMAAGVLSEAGNKENPAPNKAVKP